MVYIRGHARDYDRWANDEGAKGWTYADVLPYFRKAQSHELGPDEYRGGDGPLRVTTRHQPCELFDVFVEAGKQAGYSETSDLNGYRQEGVGMMDATIADGYRWSASTAYLWPAMQRPNVSVLTGRHTTRVLFEGGEGTCRCKCHRT
jgi:choline dehydrogenase